MVQTTHPSVPVFLADLHRQVALADMHMGSISSGQCRPISHFEVQNGKIASIMATLTDSNIMLVLTLVTNVRMKSGNVVTGAFRVLAESQLSQEPARGSTDLPSDVGTQEPFQDDVFPGEFVDTETAHNEQSE